MIMAHIIAQCRTPSINVCKYLHIALCARFSTTSDTSIQLDLKHCIIYSRKTFSINKTICHETIWTSSTNINVYILLTFDHVDGYN